MDSGAVVILLKDLIMEYSRVSLPCLGSFMSEYSPAIISDGKIHPPSKKVVFHQNEIWNDEKLENRIAETNSVSIGVAKEELAFWIDNLCVLLATGEDVLLPELGRLYVSKQAKLMFEQESENLLTESFGLESVDIRSFGLTDDELAEFSSTHIRKDEPRKKDRNFGTKGLITGVIVILILAVAAIFAIFGHILADDSLVPSPAAPPVKAPDSELQYEEYFTPKYGIVLSSFEKFSEARDFSGKVSGTSVYCMDSETPYSVIFTYPSRESSGTAIDSLTKIYSTAYIIELKIRNHN